MEEKVDSDDSAVEDLNPSVDIHCLPDEVLEYILSLTSPYSDLNSALQVCKRWYHITKAVIRGCQQQFLKAISGSNEIDLCWRHHQPESGPTVTERYSHSACYYDKSVYVFGGCTSTSTTFNDLWRFDLQHARWIRPLATGSYPSPKACASLVVYKDCLLLFGGWSHPTPYTFHQASKFFNQLSIYNPSSSRWTEVVTVDSPDGIAGHGASVIGDFMVVFGGYHGHGNSSNDVWLLNLKQMVWSQQPTSEPKPLPRYSHAQVLLTDQHILILGGCGGPNTQFTDAWLLEISCQPWKWTELTVNRPDLAAQHLWCHPACKIGDKLVVLGKNMMNKGTSVMKSQPVKVQMITRQMAASNIRSDTNSEELPTSSRDGMSANNVTTHTAGVHAGMPSVRPNAMKDRRRQLEALNKYEDRLRAAAQAQTPVAAASLMRQFTTAGMCVHVLDIREAVMTHCVSWMPVLGTTISDAPSEAIFYSMVKGHGELIMFGGIRGDARSLQRGNSSLQPQAVSNDVHFLSYRINQIC